MMLSDIYLFNIFLPDHSSKTLFQPHWHEECLEIIYFVEGTAEFHIRGVSYTAAPGDLFSLPKVLFIVVMSRLQHPIIIRSCSIGNE